MADGLAKKKAAYWDGQLAARWVGSSAGWMAVVRAGQ